jgi:hypothetical protein
MSKPDSDRLEAPMVKVYKFKVFDSLSGVMLVQPLMSQKDRIDLVGGTIIGDSAREVDEAELDDQGRFDPRKKRAADAPKT